jgi:hypothetical protein
VVRHLALERGGGSLERCRGPAVCGVAETFWAMGLSLPWVVVVHGVIHGLWVRLFTFIFFLKGCFPRY